MIQSQMEEEYSQECIILNEEPVKLTSEELKKLHHRSLGGLTFEFRGQIKAGSGVLISEDLILTCAHNVCHRPQEYQKKHNEMVQYTNHRFYIGADGPTQTYYEVQAYRYPYQYRTSPTKQLMFDFALLKLRTPIKFYQYLPLTKPCSICLPKQKARQVKIYGFPHFKDNFKPISSDGKKINLHQYGLIRSDRIQQIQPSISKIAYKISTLQGQSGCPLVVDDKIIAVHTGSGKTNKQSVNVGRIIDLGLIEKLTKWTKQLNGHPFSIQQQGLCEHVEKKKLNLSRKGLQSIHFSNQEFIFELDISQNMIKSIDLRNFPCLGRLNVSHNYLSNLDLSNNTSLIYLNLQNNKFAELNIKANIKIVDLMLANNRISFIDLSRNTQLRVLDIRNNKISFISLDNNKKLKKIDLSENQLDEIVFSDDSVNNLEQLSLESNNLTKVYLPISENALMKSFEAFSFSNQTSQMCQVKLKWQRKQHKDKLAQMTQKWNAKYNFTKPWYKWFMRDERQDCNKHKCRYNFIVV